MTVDEMTRACDLTDDDLRGVETVDPGRLRRWVMAAIVWYQRAVDGRPSPCRFTPSCSSYALESFEMHPTGRATWLTFRRLTKCRPFGPSGYDPVPDGHRASAQPTHLFPHSHEDY